MLCRNNKSEITGEINTAITQEGAVITTGTPITCVIAINKNEIESCRKRSTCKFDTREGSA
jgi:hypothetical protein